MSANERRMAILEVLCERRHETVENLMQEFGASNATIRRDIQALILSYPIYTTQGKYGGGIYVMEGYRFGKKYLSGEQEELLKRLSKNLQGDDLATMKSILKGFSSPKK